GAGTGDRVRALDGAAAPSGGHLAVGATAPGVAVHARVPQRALVLQRVAVGWSPGRGAWAGADRDATPRPPPQAEKGAAEERDQLAAGLPWLAVIATVSPLLALLGTVIGVMNSFVGVAHSGSANIAAVAPGIAEALVTTVAGLAVAIPAVIAYNYF